jgi:hypothetical protein
VDDFKTALTIHQTLQVRGKSYAHVGETRLSEAR